MSRLAGAGGAAESALMNDHADASQPDVGGVAGSNNRVHDKKFTGISGLVQAIQLFSEHKHS